MRCLILSAGVGGGHARAAQALEKAFHRFTPGVEARHVATKLPAARLKTLLDEIRPDHVMATHFVALDALAGKGVARKLPFRVSGVITDFAVHASWFRPGIDRWFVANDECAAVLARRGCDRERIFVTGIPVDPAFADAVARVEAKQGEITDEGMARPDARPESGRRRLRVLLAGEGLGAADVSEIAKAILGMRGAKTPGHKGRRVHLTVIAGGDEEARDALEALHPDTPHDAELTVRGVVANVEEEMARADLLVTRACGLAAAEAMVMALPTFLLDGGADWLVEEGAAKTAGSLDALEWKLDRAIAEPVWLAKMRERARAIRRPDAARRIVEAAATLVQPDPLREHTERMPAVRKK